MSIRDNNPVTVFQIKDLPFIFSALQEAVEKSEKTGIPISPEMEATYKKPTKPITICGAS